MQHLPSAGVETVAHDYQYALSIPADERRSQSVAWLWVAVLTLLIAGFFSVILVLARTPGIGEHFPYTDLFGTALVIHVNLSSLVWILAFAFALWCLNSRPVNPLLSKSIYKIVLLGVMLMSVSPFTGDAQAIMSNYIPVLDDRFFQIGLLIFLLGSGLQVLVSMHVMKPAGKIVSGQGVIRFGLACAAIGVCVALLAFFWTWLVLPRQLTDNAYYEYLFWGGGHILQFTYTLLMMVAWLWLASVAGISLPFGPRVALFFFAIGLVAIFLSPLVYIAYPVTDLAHRQLFTLLMSFGGSLAVVPLGIALLTRLFRDRPAHGQPSLAWNALLTSLLLFGIGGLMGFLIDGNNVSIPAHYHGCIVGITLALMGLCYQLLPALVNREVAPRPASWQLRIYALGQFMHISGLLWSGGYGVERKVAGTEQWLNTAERMAAMGLMGLGGLLSALGGFVFILLVVKVLREGLAERKPGSQASTTRQQNVSP